MIIIYMISAVTSVFILCLLSFWVGRCARQLPVIDHNLPWTVSRGQSTRCSADYKAVSIRPPDSSR